jgi:hypothetical protein
MNPYLDTVEEEDKPVKVLPCRSDPDQWFVEATTPRNSEVVDAVIRECLRCPALDACGELAAKIRPTHGVWAGRDWTKPPSHQPRGDRITRQHMAGARKREAT